MKVIQSATELSRALIHPIAFVPTMGALHAGHQSLIKKAREVSENVIVSVYVNPLQFENQEDLTSYPSSPRVDEELAAAAGATILWRPNQSELYPDGITKISSGEVGAIYEGNRAGHFDGVLTVVHALFSNIKPTWAIFGEKDLQQLFLIRKMAREFFPATKVLSGETIRESSGLALSSRNSRLSIENRNYATVLFRSLQAAQSQPSISEMKREMLATLKSEPSFTLDYAEIIDDTTFDFAVEASRNKRAIIAGWINGIRLIDNMAMQNIRSASEVAAI